MKAYLFYGKAPAQPGSKAPRDIRPFLTRKEFGGQCFCNCWPETWQTHKTALLAEWRKDHSGQCWAEINYPEMLKEWSMRKNGTLPPLSAEEIAAIRSRIDKKISDSLTDDQIRGFSQN